MEKYPSLQDLTDEEILKEFVKRFQCDGAVLVYLDVDTEYGFGRWKNSLGRKWVNNLFKALQREVAFEAKLPEVKRKRLSLVDLKSEN